MKKVILIVLMVTLFVTGAFNSKAQKEKVTQEIITQVCKDVPRGKRPRLTVARFNVTSPKKPDGQFGDNLATMLSNALQGSECYNVLERLQNSSDLLDEQNFGNSANADKKTSIKKSKMLVANVIASGEVTKFEESSKTFGFGPVKTTKSSASLGVVIKLANPETREIISQHEFNVEKKTDGGMRIGVSLPIIGNLDLTNSSMKNPAVQSAVEEAIKDAVAFIANERDKIPMPEVSLADNASSSSVIVNNIDYSQLSSLAAAIQKIPGVSVVNSDEFANNTATIIIDHTLKVRELIDNIIKANPGMKLSVAGLSKDGATLQVTK